MNLENSNVHLSGKVPDDCELLDFSKISALVCFVEEQYLRVVLKSLDNKEGHGDQQ